MGSLMQENMHASHHSSSDSGRKSENSLPSMPPKKVDFHPSIMDAPKRDERPVSQPDAEKAPEQDQDGHAAG